MYAATLISRVFAASVIFAGTILSQAADAGQLKADGWSFKDSGGNPLEGLADGKLESFCVLKPDELEESLSLTIDMQKPFMIHRVYWCGNQNFAGQDAPPKKRADENSGSITLFAGDNHSSMKKIGSLPVLPAETKPPAGMSGGPEHSIPESFNSEGDWRFQDVLCRYLRIEAEKPPADFAWTLGELEVYGFEAAAAELQEDAIVLPANPPAPLSFAASELSYYLGELTGRPHPIIPPEAAKEYSGALYKIMDMKELAPTYEEMNENIKSGKLPSETVNIELDGREVIFRAWPYRNVILSAWEFLERQGVRWAYPDPHGDLVPPREKIDVGFLPLRYTPSADRIYANFAVSDFLYGKPWDGYPYTQAYLYFWRNRWNGSWNGFPCFGGTEVPKPKEDKTSLKDEYKEGFDGYPHNFASVVPPRILEKHPDWMGLIRDERFGKENAGKRIPQLSPCYTDEGMIQFVADKAAAWAALTPGVPRRINLLPMDATVHCECEKCLALNQPLMKPDIPYSVHPTYYSSDAYFHFVCEVAKRVAKTSPEVTIGALAYANVFVPPRKIDKFPENVLVEVCMYGAMNLPVEAPPNTLSKKYLEEWGRKCGSLENYDYVLLNENSKTWPMPVPLVSAIVDWAKLQRKINALASGTQGSPEMIRFCPWNFHAYPRIRWNIDPSPGEDAAAAILTDFFSSCYRESGDAMLAYYKAAEDYHTRKNINLHVGGYQYNLPVGAFPYELLVEMSGHLKKAESTAKAWTVKKRLVPIREGFNWLLSSTGLKPEDIGGTARFPAMAPGRPPFKVTMQNADILPCPRDGDCYLMQSRRVGHIVRFEKAGEYLISFKADGFDRKDAKRELVAYVGSEKFGFVDAPDGDNEYSIKINAPEGVWEVGIMSPQHAGPLYVKGFTISPSTAGSQ